MMKALLAVRFRSLFAGLTAQGKKKKKRSTGTVVLFVLLYLYLIVIIAGVMCMTFYSLAEAYHPLGLDWLYFAMAGLMGLAFAMIGSVFTTQNQLYDAKDNELLLSMPVRPGAILMSRMLPLLAMNLLFAGIVIIPAIVMYGIFVEFSFGGILLQIIALMAVCLLAQAISCLLGWFLHKLLSRINKSVGSLLFMVVFLGIYFAVYSQAGNILQTIAQSGQLIADALRTWVWPLYAMGRGCLGSIGYILGFAAICAGLFGLVYWLLSVTFLHTATASRSSRKRRRLDIGNARVSSPVWAIVHKELRKFLGCPVYLTNMGLGVILTGLLPVAALIFRDKIEEFLLLLNISAGYRALIICAILTFTLSTACISTPSVSLEGKNLWILRSMPVVGKDILLGKLYLHLLLTAPIATAAGLVMSIAFGCGIADILLCMLVPALLAGFTGLLGLWAGLMWAKLDYISEAYPCKQSLSVLAAMFIPWGLAIGLGIGYFFVFTLISPAVFLLITAVILAAICAILYRVITGWGVTKWESLQA